MINNHRSKGESSALQNHVDGYFDVDVLFPKPIGLMFTIKCHSGTRFREIKDKVWEKIRDVIEFGQKDKYCFEGINMMAVQEKYDDDKMTLAESKLSYYLLKLVEKPQSDGKKEKMHLADLLMLCGRNVQVDISQPQNEGEVMWFREIMANTALNCKNFRDSSDYKTLLMVKYPLSTSDIPPCILDFEDRYNVMRYTIVVNTAFKNSIGSTLGKMENTENFLVPFRTTVRVMLQSLIALENIITSGRYVLKASGREDYFFDDTLILPQYNYIQSCIRNNTIPVLVLSTYDELCRTNDIPDRPESTSPVTLDDMFPDSPLLYEPVDYRCVSQIDDRLNINIISLALSDQDLNRKNLVKVYVALYSGGKRLEQLESTERATTSVIEWNEKLSFDIKVADLPRDSKLCFSIKRRQKKSNNKDTPNMSSKSFESLYWINMTIFDFQGTIRHGVQEKPVWKESRSKTGFKVTGTCFPYTLADTPLFSVAFLSPLCSYYSQAAARQIALNETGPTSLHAAQETSLSDEERGKLEKLLSHLYGMHKITEEESDFLWKHRVHCVQYPHSLPLLVSSQIFDSLQKTTQLYTLLLEWPQITVTTALQLLHPSISDPHVRTFAVYSLDYQLSDNMISVFLLQLVECLKYEPYLDSALLRFLLRRALGNNILGHELYWQLKSEVESIEFGVQFSMYIEFYLRCCGNHMKELNMISDSMSKVEKQYEKIKKMSTEELKTAFNSSSDLFCGAISITKPKLRTKELIPERTKVFDSAMKPILLRFSNQDSTCKDTFGMIYKEGDDLRQDQLVLQIITLINKIWLSENLDMRLIVYTARCTRRRTGVIEEIKNSETLSRIIMKLGSLSIEKWLKEKNPSTEDFNECRQNFIMSCCGYSLIQYVLGISDRHPSNIMLTEDGKLVHIDFGHFLGNTKRKLGVNREPSPFIFMKEFADLISPNGEDEFKKFEKLFVKAYLILRAHSEQFLTIFHLMLSANLPELNQTSHILYFTKAMCIGATEDQAERKILGLLHESIRMTTQQKFQWLPHVVKHA